MRPHEALGVILSVLADVAPEVDSDQIDPGVDLTEQLDLDSMDYLNWMLGINRETGIEIPERDYPKFMTLNGAVDYLVGSRV
jgi:acyl carrier protein